MNHNTLEGILKLEMDRETEGEEVGIVVSLFDGIVICEGLNNVMYGEQVRINNTIIGMVFALEGDYVKVLVIDDYLTIKEGDFIYPSKELFSIKLPEKIHELLGKSWNTKDLIKKEYDTGESHVVDKEACNFMDRDFVNEALETGIIAIDSMMAIGRGQRQLILGNTNSGKTTLVMDMIINQRDSEKKIYCIYVSIGQKASAVKKVEDIFRDKNLFSYSMIINASSAHNPGLQYITPYVAMTIAEAFQSRGEDVIIFFDDLTKHGVAYRSIKLLLRDIPGREAYSGDIFYLHARLLERCGKFKNGGSITGIPILSTYDVTGYIATNVISITDGQLFLDSDAFNKGHRPAINVGISVSRLGSGVQSKYMKKVCKSLKIDLSAAEELANFAQILTDLEEDTKKILQKGENIKKILTQKNYEPYKLWQEVVMLYVVLNELSPDISKGYFNGIFEKIKKDYAHIVQNISQDKKIEETLEEIRSIILCN